MFVQSTGKGGRQSLKETKEDPMDKNRGTCIYPSHIEGRTERRRIMLDFFSLYQEVNSDKGKSL